MKKIGSFIVVLVCVSILGMTVAGCDNGTTDNGDDNNGGGGSGTLTITGLGAHDGKYVVADDNASSGISGVID
jgi:hypothetical protein